ncbi:putative Uracil phosphoribosyltransferase [Paratrimastix pyriformis]|uniref:superoxide dismutase n=1 Tax=Paratrimastix pyriformis TaxID=342808 RepID=A0ABQ8UBS5_9EUKA|nr:putative Uracil phosphoribosyltransferase [Paratrimastix pyriformis]
MNPLSSCPHFHLIHQNQQIRAMLTILRDRNTDRADFIFYADRLFRLLIEEALSMLPYREKQITTPTGSVFTGCEFSSNLAGVSIVRSGESMEAALRCVCKKIRIGKILIQRNEASADKAPIHYYTKLPHDIADRHVLLLDPMLASGGSARAAIEILKEHGVPESRIIFVNMIAAPEGVRSICSSFPALQIVSCALDDYLNDEKYIIPGVGDFGDRYFGTEVLSSHAGVLHRPLDDRGQRPGNIHSCRSAVKAQAPKSHKLTRDRAGYPVNGTLRMKAFVLLSLAVLVGFAFAESEPEDDSYDMDYIDLDTLDAPEAEYEAASVEGDEDKTKTGGADTQNGEDQDWRLPKILGTKTNLTRQQRVTEITSLIPTVLSILQTQIKPEAQMSTPAELPLKENLLAKLKAAPLQGISTEMLEGHWALYKGYVNNFNTLRRELNQARANGDYSLATLDHKRRLNFELNGVILHELYFSNLTPRPTPPSDKVKQYFAQYFGTFEKFMEELVNTASKTRGIGWTIVYADPYTCNIHWVEMHENGNPAGCMPLVVLDCWEHAFAKDYGNTGRPNYVAAVTQLIDWGEVEQRLDALTSGHMLQRHY